MTDRQKYAIKLAINTMGIHLDSHCNTAYVNRKTGVSVGYGEAINILSDMLSNADNHTCSCQYNSNSRDNEPCCRCDSRKENRKVEIVTVSDLIKILDTKENIYGATGKPRILNLSLNGIFAGSIESVKLDGYGDGLITDVTMEITSSKFTTTNADRIRNMSDEELTEFLVGFKNTFGEEYEGEASCMEWLQSEVEQEGKQ